MTIKNQQWSICQNNKPNQTKPSCFSYSPELSADSFTWLLYVYYEGRYTCFVLYFSWKKIGKYLVSFHFALPTWISFLMEGQTHGERISRNVVRTTKTISLISRRIRWSEQDRSEIFSLRIDFDDLNFRFFVLCESSSFIFLLHLSRLLKFILKWAWT